MDSSLIPKSGMFQSELRTGQTGDLASFIDTQALVEAASAGKRSQLGNLSPVKERSATTIAVCNGLLGITDRLTDIIDHKGRTLVVARKLPQKVDNAAVPEHRVVPLPSRCRPA